MHFLAEGARATECSQWRIAQRALTDAPLKLQRLPKASTGSSALPYELKLLAPCVGQPTMASGVPLPALPSAFADGKNECCPPLGEASMQLERVPDKAQNSHALASKGAARARQARVTTAAGTAEDSAISQPRHASSPLRSWTCRPSAPAVRSYFFAAALMSCVAKSRSPMEPGPGSEPNMDSGGSL
mmetsp:Transcript_69668/g.192658  ORF Transcript_69668/g.192658 Transcript_69668/m.192658 type:complete len:187 (-) Transcript_69668:70-630(-)